MKDLLLGYLYPTHMSTYGDIGNVTCLKQRAAWHGFSLDVVPLEIGDPLPTNIDIYFFGGGQDAAQASLVDDLHTKGSMLSRQIKSGTPLLAICGGYQLLGKAYYPFDQKPLGGLGIFPVDTHASHDRMIGNTIIKAHPSFTFKPPKEYIVGFENHSGKTNFLDETIAHPLGVVQQGFGNNGSDKTEGCVIHNAIGSYLHGSLLPKNPHLADWLLQKALARKDLIKGALPALDDKLEWQAHQTLLKRFLRQ